MIITVYMICKGTFDWSELETKAKNNGHKRYVCMYEEVSRMEISGITSVVCMFFW